ncbi:hypothetical protein [Streptomyces macrolidinus]|nr:hypothetical protein [Streptomyces macrolidinus]
MTGVGTGIHRSGSEVASEVGSDGGEFGRFGEFGEFVECPLTVT